MAQVTLSIAGRSHIIPCREGEEAQLRRLGTMIEERAETAIRAAGPGSGERILLYIALMLADRIDELERNPAGAGVAPVLLDRIADRLEAVALALEDESANA